jgi:hypothetical protein
MAVPLEFFTVPEIAPVVAAGDKTKFCVAVSFAVTFTVWIELE